MNASLMGTAGSASWIVNSDVVHAVSSTPEGPYRAADIALGPRGQVVRKANCTYQGGIPGQVCDVVQANDYWDAATAHTPAAQRDPVSGNYLIFYMGTMQNRTNGKRGFPCLTNDNPPQATEYAGGSDCQQRVGLAVSKDPAGPWRRWDSSGLHNESEQSTFILPPGGIGDFDSAFTNNPTPLALKVCKREERERGERGERGERRERRGSEREQRERGERKRERERDGRESEERERGERREREERERGERERARAREREQRAERAERQRRERERGGGV
jgi:hypothetical protein